MLWPGQQQVHDEDQDEEASQHTQHRYQHRPPFLSHKVYHDIDVGGGKETAESVQGTWGGGGREGGGGEGEGGT